MDTGKRLLLFYGAEPGFNLIVHIGGRNLSGTILYCLAEGGPCIIPKAVTRGICV